MTLPGRLRIIRAAHGALAGRTAENSKKMKKMLQRLLIFFIGVPLITAAVQLLPQYGHLALNVIVIIFSAAGAVELAAMLEKRELRVSAVEAAALGALPPALVTMVVSFNCGEWIVPAFLFVSAVWVLVFPVFSAGQEQYINRVTAGFSVLFYPGIFLAWICRMGKWEGALILVSLLIPLVGDGAAWAAGMLFGRQNRGVVKVSPNKSIAGFAGELFATVVISTAAVLFLPEYFVPRRISAIAGGIIVGLLTGIAATFGDLCESAVKRSAGCKDSGGLIAGRGGVLDSVDSIALAVPVFYYTWQLFFTQY
jgi:phosphatidate cytidylyltransferase